jgi:hypothetical protein
MNFFKRKSANDSPEEDVVPPPAYDGAPPLDQVRPFKEAILPVIACGAGLFSDGYINNVSKSFLMARLTCV